MSEQVYTKDELDGMSRVDLRRIAVQVHGMDNKECSNTKSEALKDWIMEQQEGGGGKSNGKTSKATAAAKSSSKSSRSSKASKTSTSKAKASAAPTEASGDLGTLIERVDAVGKGLDENQEEVKELLQQVSDTLTDINRQQFVTFGLLTDLYKVHFEPDELDDRMGELEKEYEEGNG